MYACLHSPPNIKWTKMNTRYTHVYCNTKSMNSEILCCTYFIGWNCKRWLIESVWWTCHSISHGKVSLCTYLLSPLRARWHIRQTHILSTQLGPWLLTLQLSRTGLSPSALSLLFFAMLFLAFLFSVSHWPSRRWILGWCCLAFSLVYGRSISISFVRFPLWCFLVLSFLWVHYLILSLAI